MFYKDEIIEEVGSRNDIVDVISSYVNLKKKGSSYFGLCPFHSEKSPSFSVSREKQMFFCFGCQKGGNVFKFLMEYENYTYPEAIEYLADRAGMELPKNEMSLKERKEADYRALLREMNTVTANYFYKLLFHEHGKRGYEYFKERGILDDTIKKFGLGFADIYKDDLYQYLKKKGYTDAMLKNSGLVRIKETGVLDRFWNRVMFPIVDMNGKVIGFGGRVMGEGEPKYLNSEETALFYKKKNLYGLNFARKSKRDGIIICEGYMDVISMHQAGFDNTVASLGTAYTSEQASLIKRYTDKIFLAYDSDGAGTNAALKAIDISKNAGLLVRVITMTPYKDPDEFIKNLGKDAYEERVQEAMSATMFRLAILARNVNMNDPGERTEFHQKMAQVLAQIEEKIERDNYIEAAANEYMVDQKALYQLVDTYGQNLNQKKAYEEIKKQDTKERRSEKSRKENAKTLPTKLLITWLVNEPHLFSVLKDIISPDDFIDELSHKVALLLYEQYEREQKIMPQLILNQFMDMEEQNEVAILFHTTLSLSEEEQKEKAITDIVKKVKLASLDKQLNEITDMSKFQELVKKRKEIEQLHISLVTG